MMGNTALKIGREEGKEVGWCHNIGSSNQVPARQKNEIRVSLQLRPLVHGACFSFKPSSAKDPRAVSVNLGSWSL